MRISVLPLELAKQNSTAGTGSDNSAIKKFANENRIPATEVRGNRSCPLFSLDGRRRWGCLPYQRVCFSTTSFLPRGVCGGAGWRDGPGSRVRGKPQRWSEFLLP